MNEIDQQRSLAIPDEIISDFQSQVRSVTPEHLHPLPDLTGYVNHEGKYSRPDVKLVPGMFVDFEALGGLAVGQLPEQWTFSVRPGDRLGRELSHNKVFFGKLYSHWLDQPLPPQEEQIAVKPLPAVHTVLGELAMFQYLRSLQLPTFQPTGLMVTDDQLHYLFTRFDQPVATMDTVEWRELDIDERWLQVGVAIDTLALLHSHMLFHGDSEFKNIAFGETGDLVIVDPELMVSAARLADVYETSPDERERELAILRVKQMMSSDFSNLIGSIEAQLFKGLPDEQRPANEAALFKCLKRQLFNPYHSAIEAIGSEHTPVLLRAFDMMLHERKERMRGH